ncbi:MAG: DUF1801 domain-containing protein [Candidatus Dormibacterales bacterium]
MPHIKGVSLSDQVTRISPATRPTVKAAIKTVREVNPKADEVVYRSVPPRSSSTMWKIVRYAVGGEYVLGIGTFTNHATMFFYRGRELDEAAILLRGTGKDMRSITLRSPADAESATVKRLVRRAFKLGAGSR